MRIFKRHNLAEMTSNLKSKKLTAEISGLKAELDARTNSLQEEGKENTDLRRRSFELTENVNTLTAKVSNLSTELKNAEERLVERGELEKTLR